MNVRIFITCFIVGFAGVWFANGQVKSRVAGLETNAQYMSLLQSEYQLKTREDSLVAKVALEREKLRLDPAKVSVYGQEILRLEGEVFDTRSKSGQLGVKINQIEQDFVVQNLDKHIYNGNSTPVVDTTSVKNLVYNDYFKIHLATDDLSRLIASQVKESQVLDLIQTYESTYLAIQQIVTLYETENNPLLADSLYKRYSVLSNLNGAVADSISKMWNFIFDNKSYAYSYIFDKMNRNDKLLWFEEYSARSASQQVELSDKYPSPATLRYKVEKGLLLEYEIQLAQTLNMQKPIDSLTYAKKQVSSLNLQHPPINIKERSFVAYKPVKIADRSPYSTAKPIPVRIVYYPGVVYSVQVGSFGKAQSPTIFRNATPLFYDKRDGKYNYYAGVLSSEEEATDAVKVLTETGFRVCEIVVWQDNQFRNLTQESRRDDSVGALYRIEILTTKSDLPKDVKELIQKSQNVDIARTVINAGDEAGNGREFLFIVSSFNSAQSAKRIFDAIGQINDELKLKIEEIK